MVIGVGIDVFLANDTVAIIVVVVLTIIIIVMMIIMITIQIKRNST